MITKAFEVRDEGTFIPVIAIKMTLVPVDIPIPELEAERYLLRRSGFSLKDNCSVVLCRMICAGVDRNATYDPYAWGGDGTRTMRVAHLYIDEHFDEMKSGDVVDVQFILGETKEPKKSERENTEYPL